MGGSTGFNKTFLHFQWKLKGDNFHTIKKSWGYRRGAEDVTPLSYYIEWMVMEIYEVLKEWYGCFMLY